MHISCNQLATSLCQQTDKSLNCCSHAQQKPVWKKVCLTNLRKELNSQCLSIQLSWLRVLYISAAESRSCLPQRHAKLLSAANTPCVDPCSITLTCLRFGSAAKLLSSTLRAASALSLDSSQEMCRSHILALSLNLRHVVFRVCSASSSCIAHTLIESESYFRPCSAMTQYSHCRVDCTMQ